MYNVYDRVYGNLPANTVVNTAYTYARMILANLIRMELADMMGW